MTKDRAQARPNEDRQQRRSGQRWRLRHAPHLADPDVSYLGPVAVWWIPKPPGPRISLRTAAITWLIGIPLTAATMLWLQAQSKPLWTFGRSAASPADLLLRYELILLVCLAYVTLRALPVWIRYRRLAKRDAAAIAAAVCAEHWDLAALLVHRYCLLVSSIWRRVPGQVEAWDAVIRPKLPKHRRIYLYYRDAPPRLPPDAAASFTPAVIPSPQPSLWSAAALVPIALLLYLLIADIVRQGRWHRLILFNTALLTIILIAYGGYFLLALLGRSHYFRFAPGVVQLLKFRLARRRPAIETFHLRRVHAVLDLSSPWPAMTLLDTPGYRRETFRLPRKNSVVEAFLRAALSTAPSPPLSQEDLAG